MLLSNQYTQSEIDSKWIDISSQLDRSQFAFGERSQLAKNTLAANLEIAEKFKWPMVVLSKLFRLPSKYLRGWQTFCINMAVDLKAQDDRDW